MLDEKAEFEALCAFIDTAAGESELVEYDGVSGLLDRAAK